MKLEDVKYSRPDIVGFEAAVKAAKAVGYVNAGTVEFIFDTVTD